MREHFGLSIDLATHIQRGLNDGSLDRVQYEGYLGKLLGIPSSPRRQGRSLSATGKPSLPVPFSAAPAMEFM